MKRGDDRRTGVAMIGVAVLSASALGGEPPRFRLVPLAGRDGSDWSGRPFALNDYGQVVGSFAPGLGGEGSGTYYSLWTPDVPLGQVGAFATLPLFPRGPLDGWANGINNSGQITGVLHVGTADRAFLWTPATPNGASGTYVDLGGVPTTSDANSAWAVNAYGQVSGHSATALGPPGARSLRGFVFRPDVPNGPAGTLIDLGQLPGGSDETSVLGLNDYGQVVGGSTTSAGFHAFLWTPTTRNGAAGAMVDLGDLPGSIESAVAHAINASGQVVGYGTVFDRVDGVGHAFRWTPASANGTAGSMKDLGTLGGAHTNSHALAVNDAGWVVGTSAAASGDDRAVLWTADDQIYDLNALLVDPPAGWSLREAGSVNNHGYVVGWAVYDPDQNPATPDAIRPYLLVPVPEPAGAGTALLVLAPALLKRRPRP